MSRPRMFANARDYLQIILTVSRQGAAFVRDIDQLRFLLGTPVTLMRLCTEYQNLFPGLQSKVKLL